VRCKVGYLETLIKDQISFDPAVGQERTTDELGQCIAISTHAGTSLDFGLS
jgi:hypothetical protein